MSRARPLRVCTVGVGDAAPPTILDRHPAVTVRRSGILARPDAVLCGVDLDSIGTALPELAGIVRRGRALVVSTSRQRHHIDTVYALGARGYLTTQASTEAAWRAVRDVASGGEAWPEGWSPPASGTLVDFASACRRVSPLLVGAFVCGPALLALFRQDYGAIDVATQLASAAGAVWILRDHAARERRRTDLAIAHSLRGERARYSRHLHDRTLQVLEALNTHGVISDSAIRSQLAAETAWLRQVVELGFEASTGDLIDVLDQAVDRYRPALSGLAFTHPEHVSPLPSAVVEAFEGCVAEALNNVSKHASTDCVTVAVASDRRRVKVEVIDVGTGFDDQALRPGCIGIRHSISGRMSAVGGTAKVTSKLGTGTQVSLMYPWRGLRTPASGSSNHR